MVWKNIVEKPQKRPQDPVGEEFFGVTLVT